MTYPDNHPDLRDNLTRIQLPGDDKPREFMPREVWEELADERDDLRRTLALLAAEWWAGDRNPQQINHLLRVGGQTPEQARATADIVAQAKAGFPS